MAEKLIVEPSHVREYARDLRNYAAKLDNDTARAIARLSALGETWRDRKYDHFKGDMKEIEKQVKRARDIVNTYSRHLIEFATRVEGAMRTKI